MAVSDKDELLSVLTARGVMVDELFSIPGHAADPELFVAAVRRSNSDLALLRDSVPTTGRWPVALGSKGLANLREASRSAVEPVEEVLARAAVLDTDAWFAEREASLGLEGDPDAPGIGDGVFVVGDRSAYDNFFFSAGPTDGPTVIALPNTSASWETPAYLWFGGWNECPEPAEHVAVLRRWNGLFGANVDFVNSESISASVDRLPESERQARELAWEHFVYAPDLLWQVAESTGGLASALATSREWHLWWD